MMIALAESLLQHGGVVRAGLHPHEAARSGFGGKASLGNGAAMRVAPVAVLYANDDTALAGAARDSASATHAHAIAIDAAVAQARAIAAALNGEPLLTAALDGAGTPELKGRLAQAARLLDTRPGPAELAAALGNRPTAHESVPAAIYAAAAHGSIEGAITFAVRSGGDTDTLAAMAGAIAGARTGASTIPSDWLDALEQGPKGRDHVERLADRLAEARGN